MPRLLRFRATAFLMMVAVFAATMPAHAADTRHEAFVRGGDAIATALNERDTRLLVPIIVPEVTGEQEPAQVQAEEKKGRPKLFWVGIGIGAAISAFLIQRSVTKHRRIFAPGL